MTRRRRNLAIASVLLLAVAVLAGTVARTLAARRLQSELGAARHEMEEGRFGLAGRRLARLAEQWPEDAEVALQLGRCALARDHPEEALAAWARAPERGPLAGVVALERSSLLARLGRFTEAEQLLTTALGRPGPEAAPLCHRLVSLLCHEGRADDARRRVEALWEDLDRSRPDRRDLRLALLSEHIGIDFELVPLEGTMAQIQGRPDDDRLGLARAYLATRSGRFDQARVELEAVLNRRDDDPVIWRAWLDWAMAAGETGPVREALAHLPAGLFDARRVQGLRAWLAARLDDAHADRRALEQQLAEDPSDPTSLTRLAELLHEVGDEPGAAWLRRRKADLDVDRDRYFRLYKLGRLADHRVELARLAERLGRRFEARGFWELALEQEPANPEARSALARLAARPASVDATAQTLAQVLAANLGPAPSVAAPVSRRQAGAPGPIPSFDEGGRSAGWGPFILDNGASPIHQLPEMSCGGIGLLDYDGDGWLDVYAVQGGRFPPNPIWPGPGDRLFHNRRDGTFADVTESAGLAALPRGYGQAVAVGDFDNDGRPDLFITRWRSYALYRNRGDGTFEDVTARAGLDGDRDWPTSAAFADLDNDGDLDLYVCHYGDWDPDHPKLCKDPSGTKFISCDPRAIVPSADHVFRNDGRRFVDVTAESGMMEHDGRGLGVVAADLDDDGRIDVFVANDTSANYLFHNQGGFRFEEIGLAAGVAANAQGGYQAGMGVACGDLDGDGRTDLAVTNFYDESTTFFQNLGGTAFADRTAAIGLAAPSRPRLGFGAAFLDANNDGHLDLMTANGHISDLRPLIPLAMTAQLFLGGGPARLIDVTQRAGPPFQQLHVGRGLAVGDLDNDGRLDALMAAQNEPLVVFRNRTEPRGHFITFRLEGSRSNRDGVGARVTIQAGGRRQVAQRFGGGSYASAGDPRLHFGLGPFEMVEWAQVHWPSGRVDRFEDLASDRGYHLREGEPQAMPLAGFGTAATGPGP
ncbi:MAG: FG-GAP-like repeat-containing protein [Isosphaeraceae bacterium]